MGFIWGFMDEGLERVKAARRSQRAYMLALNPPELGPMSWQKGGCDFPCDVKDAAEAIAALAESIQPDIEGTNWAVIQTIIDLADWIKGEAAKEADKDGEL